MNEHRLVNYGSVRFVIEMPILEMGTTLANIFRNLVDFVEREHSRISLILHFFSLSNQALPSKLLLYKYSLLNMVAH